MYITCIEFELVHWTWKTMKCIRWTWIVVNNCSMYTLNCNEMYIWTCTLNYNEIWIYIHCIHWTCKLNCDEIWNIHTALYTLIYIKYLHCILYNERIPMKSIHCMLLASTVNYSEMYTLYSMHIHCMYVYTVNWMNSLYKLNMMKYILNLYYNWTIMKYTYYTIHWTSRNILYILYIYTLYALMKCTHTCLLNLYITLNHNET